MADGIFVQRDGKLAELSTEPFASEDAFQKLLADHPELLAGSRSNPDAADRWLLVRREMGIPDQDSGGDRWAVDHLFLDREGVPTLVEVKRSTDPRIRRELVGQMLDYAANAVVYWPVEMIRSRFVARCEAEQKSADEALADFLGEEYDADAFWAKVKTNIQARRMRMVFVADVIPPELRRIVEFLNEQMDPAEVLALEIKQYMGTDLRTLVCTVIGRTAEAEQKKGRRVRIWDEDSFFASAAEKCTPRIVDAIRRVYDWARANQSVSWGKGVRYGGFGVADPKSGTAVLWAYDNGQILLPASNLQRLPPFDLPEKRQAFVAQFNTIQGVEIPDGDPASGNWPSFRLHALPLPDGAERLVEVLAWIFAEIERARA